MCRCHTLSGYLTDDAQAPWVHFGDVAEDEPSAHVALGLQRGRNAQSFVAAAGPFLFRLKRHLQPGP
jgi:hypothetical protein